MLMQLIHRLVDLDRLRGAFNWKDGAVYFPTSMFPPTHPIHCLSYHGWWVSLLTSLLRGLPPPNLGTWALWSPKSGLNIPSEPQRRLALFCGLGGWAFIFWSNLINFGSSGSKVVWLIAKYDSNYRGSQEISNLAEISSVCTSQSWGSWSMGEGTQCALIFIQMYMCRWNVHVCIGRECSSATVIYYRERKIVLSIVCIQRSLPSRKALWKYIF